jgi:hypothetical protein
MSEPPPHPSQPAPDPNWPPPEAPAYGQYPSAPAYYAPPGAYIPPGVTLSSWGRRLAAFLLDGIVQVVLTLGDERNQALHDKVANTFVINT